MAIAAGLLLALMLLLVPKMGFLLSVLLGAILAIVLGLFLVWAFCNPVDENDAVTYSASSVAQDAAGSASSEEPENPQGTSGAAATSEGVAQAEAQDPLFASSTLEGAMARGSEEPVGSAEFLPAPRDGNADDLKKIKGIGPKLETLLNELGVWHFDQIAAWTARDIAEVDEKLGAFRGRITRDEWVRQARLLARGEETAFSERVDRGELYRGDDDDAV